MTLLFHKDVFMPSDIQEQCKLLQKDMKHYTFSKHFLTHLKKKEDFKHNYLVHIVHKCLKSLVNTPQEAFEIEFKDNKIAKYCCRIPYSKKNDLVVVIKPILMNNLIITAWLNRKNDVHKKLNKDKYNTETDWINYIKGK